MSRACCERCWYREGISGLWDAQKKFWGVCDHCPSHECCAMDCGYSWVSETYMPEKQFSADYYATQCEFQLASYPTICALMGAQSRSRLAGSVARAAKRCIDADPNTKPDYRTVKGMVANDPDLKGFIPAFILTIFFGWVIQKLLDFIWSNWTAMPNGEPD